MWTRTLALAAALAAPLGALACSPNKSIDIYFAKNSAEVSAEQLLRLANWTATLRARYPNRQGIYLGSNAETGEIGAPALALERARNVRRIMQDDLKFSAPSFDSVKKGRVVRAGSYGPEDVKRVEIDFLPACPHECPCQADDPHGAAKP